MTLLRFQSFGGQASGPSTRFALSGSAPTKQPGRKNRACFPTGSGRRKRVSRPAAGLRWRRSARSIVCLLLGMGIAMTGIQFLTDEKGRKTAVVIDLKRHRALWEDFWDGLVSESRRKEKSIPYEEYRARRLKRSRPRG